MGFTIALAQCRRPEDGNVVASVRAWAQRAVAVGADLLVFPEALMSRFEGSVERFAAAAEPRDGAFCAAVDAIAAEFGLWVVYTMNERNLEGLPFNTAVVTDPTGTQRGAYRKMHLFDKQGESESRYTSAGDAFLEPVATPFARIGLGICYDLRFPEIAHAAAEAGANLMIYPSAWVAGPDKVNQWKALLRERAVETGMVVVGVSSVDPNRTGHSTVFDAHGAELVTSDGSEQLVTCVV